MRYEMQNFVKFATIKKPSKVGQKPKRDEHKRLRKIAPTTMRSLTITLRSIGTLKPFSRLLMRLMSITNVLHIGHTSYKRLD